jgi:exopolysaccharide biosynthesis polyprenyl glycosylphosphotransferase
LALFVTDGVAVALALGLAQTLRFGGLPSPRYAALAAVVWVGWMTALAATRSRQIRIIGIGLDEYRRVVNSTLLTYAAIAMISLHFKVDPARGYLAAAIPGGLLLLVLGRVAWRRRLAQMRRQGRCLTGAIVIGRYRDVLRTCSELQRNLTAGYRPIAVVFTEDVDHARVEDGPLAGLPAIELSRVVETVASTRIRAVMIAGDLPGGHERIRDIGWALENMKTELILVSRLIDVAGPRMHLRRVEGLPMVHVDLPQYSGINHTIKRVFDVVVGSILVVLLVPVLAVVALAIRLEGDGPVFFRQERVGLQGGRFTLLKFRSMVVDADTRLDLLRGANDGNGVLFKMRRDPRVTRVGGFLRRHSLDELPQLFNVLAGSMSLVGPRPPLPDEVELYEDRVSRRLLTKPGMTGLWQVGGRSRLSWEESVKLDLYYVENWSITGDLVILAKTFRAVISGDGAY